MRDIHAEFAKYDITQSPEFVKYTTKQKPVTTITKVRRGRRPLSDIKVGETVIIIDKGRVFSSYNTMAVYLGATTWKPNTPFEENWLKDRWIVVDYARHEGAYTIVYLLRNSLTNAEILISKRGIAKI